MPPKKSSSTAAPAPKRTAPARAPKATENKTAKAKPKAPAAATKKVPPTTTTAKKATSKKAAAQKAPPQKVTANGRPKATPRLKKGATKKKSGDAADGTAAATETTGEVSKGTQDLSDENQDVHANGVIKPPPAKPSKKRKAGKDLVAAPPTKIRIPLLKEWQKNKAPTQKLDVYVFGEGSSGELGLGTAKNAVDVKRPRLNPLLPAASVGVVQLATGGMHVIALTHDNKILTWGVNDQGALGRDTEWEGGLVDIEEDKSDDASSDSGEDSGMNPKEATPTAIPSYAFPEDTKFVCVCASDSASFALTEYGLVYGWGTFRSNEGIFGFSKVSFIQRTPVLIPELKKICEIKCGANHALALDVDGNVFAWGCGQQNQLGRRVIERTKIEGLVPREFGLPRGKIVEIACGSYHSFAREANGTVWAWGLNSFGETGIPDNAGDDNAVILKPTKVLSLFGMNIKMLAGGGHHSCAVTIDFKCLVWGRLDGYQTGLPMDLLKSLGEDKIKKDEHDRPRILKVPTELPNIKADFVACGTDHTVVISKEGKAYSWGFSANYQTGQGTDDDIEVATMIDNTAVREKKLNWAGAGGQYSMLTAPAEPKPTANGAE